MASENPLLQFEPRLMIWTIITFLALFNSCAIAAVSIVCTSPSMAAPPEEPPAVPKPPAMTLMKCRFIARHMI